jgi:hypothetical protein
MKTLNEQYRLIKENKGHKGMFLTEAKRQFPNYIRNAATFDEAEKVLKQKGVITENFTGLEPINSPFSTKVQEPFELAYAKFLEEAKSPEIKAKEVKAKKLKSQEDDEKAELKKPSKQVEEDQENIYDQKDDKNLDNLIFDQVMTGYYAEMKDPKNADKTMEQLKDIVLKNLAKDPIFYTKDGQFGVKGLGYTTEAPGLGTPKEAKGKYKASGYGDLKESIGEQKIRKAIRAIVSEELNNNIIDEANQLVNINTSNIKGGGGKRFVPTKFAFPDMVRKRFGDHIVFSNGTLYISAILFNNLVKGYANQPAIKKLLMDIPMPIKQMLNKTENYGSTVELPKQYKIYHPFKATVEKAKEDKFNKAGNKQYWSAGDLLIPNLMAGAGAEKVEESKLRNVISSIIRQELTENVDKRLKEIEDEAAMEAMGSKMEKIMAEIEKRQMQLGKLDEDEDLKAMMDKKATGKIQKEIKLLEKAKAKVEKIMGKGKGKKVEVIDEIDEDDIESYEEEADSYASRNMDDIESGNTY